MVGTIIVVILLLILVIFIIRMFNQIVKSANENIDSLRVLDEVLKKRLELIPNLQEIVKKYPEDVTITIEDTKEIENALLEKMIVKERQKLEDKFSTLFKDVFDAAQKNSNLQNSEEFAILKNKLTDIEKEIEVVRRAYNDTTRNYNALVKKSFYKILASILGYSRRDFFDVDLITKEEATINFVDRRQVQR